jgi:hypothetical protein
MNTFFMFVSSLVLRAADQTTTGPWFSLLCSQ